MPKHTKKREGFVLLMTILLIAIAGLLMAGIARYSLRLAVESVEAQDDLQRRWGALSCRRALLQNADAILQKQGEENRKGENSSPDVATLAARVTLGDMTFDLLLADETAKVSLNAIYRRQGKDGVTQTIQKMTLSHGNLQPRLRPYRTNDNFSGIAFDSWGQVFSFNRPSDGFGADASVVDQLPAATGELTCWGEGRLNLERASDDAVERTFETLIDAAAAQRLLELRRNHFIQKAAVEALIEKQKSQNEKLTPEQIEQLAEQQKKLKKWLSELPAGLGLRGEEQSQLAEAVTDRSTCHSLWITVRSRQRSWRQFCVGSRENASEWKERSFWW